MDVLKVSTSNPLISRNYNLRPPGFVEDIPYAAQVCKKIKFIFSAIPIYVIVNLVRLAVTFIRSFP